MLEKILSFVLDNWFYLLSILISFIGIICILCKKNKFVDNSLVAVLEKLPGWINEAESLEDKSAKFSYVFSLAIQYLVSLTGKDEKEVVDKYCVVIHDAIENILSTPQKKGR